MLFRSGAVVDDEVTAVVVEGGAVVVVGDVDVVVGRFVVDLVVVCFVVVVGLGVVVSYMQSESWVQLNTLPISSSPAAFMQSQSPYGQMHVSCPIFQI